MAHDIYDRETFRLVKADVTLGKRSGKHKDLTEKRYLKTRIGTEAEKIDYDGLTATLREALTRIEWLETVVMSNQLE